MSKIRRLIPIPVCLLLSVSAFSASRAHAESMPMMMTDRPGFTFSGMSVGRGVFQAELGVPSVMMDDMGDFEMRTIGLAALLRYGLTDHFELRVGAPVYTESRMEMKMEGMTMTDRGFGDVEVGAKWQLTENRGSRPAFSIIPSVILPTGDDGFTADDAVYQLNLAAEWMSGGWDLMTTVGLLDGKAEGDRYQQETFAAWLGRRVAPRWWLYGEGVYMATDRLGMDDGAFLGAGLKFQITNDFQLDAGFDHGLTDGSPDWMYGLGISFRF